MGHADGAAFVVEKDFVDRAARPRLAAFRLHHADQAPAQNARAPSDVGAAVRKEAALGNRVEHPPQPSGIVGVVTEVRCERKLRRLVVAEQPVEHLRQAQAHIPQQRPELQGQHRRVQKPPQAVVVFADHRHRLPDRCHPLEESVKSQPMPGEAGCQRLLGGVEAVRQDEGRIEQPTAHFVERSDRHEFEVPEDAQRAQDPVLGVERISEGHGFV